MSYPEPTQMKIGALNFNVRWFDREEENRDGRFGYCETDELQIGVSTRLAPCRKAEIFLHECLHALWMVFDLGPKGEEEKVCTCIAQGATMLWRDNPEAFKWWTALLAQDVQPEPSGRLIRDHKVQSGTKLRRKAK